MSSAISLPQNDWDFSPRIFRWNGTKVFYYRKNSTTFTLRLLPLGGYVRMAGEADDGEDELKPGTPVTLQLNDQGVVTSINTSNKHSLFQGIPLTVTDTNLDTDLYVKGYENGDETQVKSYPVDHDATIIEKDGTALQIAPRDVQFQSASLPNRMLTNVAGVFNNLLLAILVYTILGFVQGGVQSNTNKVDVMPTNSVARSAGMKSGDRIIEVNGHKTTDWEDLTVQSGLKQIKKLPSKLTEMVRTKCCR